MAEAQISESLDVGTDDKPKSYIFEIELMRDVIGKRVFDGKHYTWINDLVMDTQSNQIAGFIAGGDGAQDLFSFADDGKQDVYWLADRRVFIPYRALKNRFGMVSCLDEFVSVESLPENHVSLYSSRLNVMESLKQGLCLTNEEKHLYPGVKERTVRPFMVRIRDNGEVTLIFMEIPLEGRQIHYASRPSAINWTDGVLTGIIRKSLYEIDKSTGKPYRVDESDAIERWRRGYWFFSSFEEPSLWYNDEEVVSWSKEQNPVEATQQMQNMIYLLTTSKQICPLNLFSKEK